MSDDTPATPAKLAPTDVTSAPTVFVRGGGTGTTRSENLFEARFQEAEVRRDEAARDAEQASNSVDVQKDDGGVLKLPSAPDKAVQYSSRLTAHPEVPVGYLLLKFLNQHGSPLEIQGTQIECLADLLIGVRPQFPTELCLIMMCPRCAYQSHKHAQDNQIRIFSRNIEMQYNPAAGAPFVEFEGQRYRSAGQISVERFSCPDCTWRAAIDKNVVRSL